MSPRSSCTDAALAFRATNRYADESAGASSPSDPALSTNLLHGRNASCVERHVSFIIFPDALLLDLAGPLQVFEFANRTGAAAGSGPGYRISVGSNSGGLVRTSSGVKIETIALEALGPIDTVVVVGGCGVHAAARDPLLKAWMAKQAASARRICSVCTGAFLLASSGLLQGRRAVTHWGSCSLLQTQHPSTTVLPNAIYLQDGQVWTSAGATAGIDLALALVEEDYGRSTVFPCVSRQTATAPSISCTIGFRPT